MGKVTIEFRGFKSEAVLSDEVVERIYNTLPALALEKGQTTLNEISLPKPEAKTQVQKPLPSQTDIKYPTNEEVRDFIKTFPNYEFSLPLICNQFIGFTPSSKHSNSGRLVYDRIWNRIRVAKKLIANEEKGEWTRTTKDREIFYRFEKAVQGA